jgi:hypothetical protein
MFSLMLVNRYISMYGMCLVSIVPLDPIGGLEGRCSGYLLFVSIVRQDVSNAPFIAAVFVREL